MEWETVRFRLGGFGASGENLGFITVQFEKVAREPGFDFLEGNTLPPGSVGGRVVMGLIDRCSCV